LFLEQEPMYLLFQSSLTSVCFSNAFHFDYIDFGPGTFISLLQGHSSPFTSPGLTALIQDGLRLFVPPSSLSTSTILTLVQGLSSHFTSSGLTTLIPDGLLSFVPPRLVDIYPSCHLDCVDIYPGSSHRLDHLGILDIYPG